MIITLKTSASSTAVDAVLAIAARIEGLEPRVYTFEGSSGSVVEVHLVGDTAQVPESAFTELPEVARVVRVSDRYRLIGRHGRTDAACGFEYQGLAFDESRVHVLAGLCAVDTRQHVAIDRGFL